MNINTEPKIASSFTSDTMPKERIKRVYGQDPKKDADIDLYTDRFSSTDEFEPYDISKNPDALYEFPDGFGSLFPAQALISMVARNPETSLAITNVDEAEQLAGSLSDDDPYKDYAMSSLALHQLYAGKYDEANRLLHLIKDEAAAAHVLEHIITKEREDKVLSASEENNLLAELRATAEVMAAQGQYSKAAILGRAAVLLGDEKLVDFARRLGEVHFSQPQTVATVSPISRRVGDDDAVKIDMSSELLRA